MSPNNPENPSSSLNPYDVKLYVGQTYSLSCPEHLYCMAKLFKLNPKDYKTARVLELGAGTGANVIPFADNFPESQVVAIDLSAKQVAAGNALIKECKLKNIQLLEQSILDVDKKLGDFDYIICHGVYSWVPKEVQDKIMDICRNNLAPEGVAYISYNTLPCWNMIRSIREMMLYHSASFDDIDKKVQQSRALLTFLADGLTNENTPYAKFLKQEIQNISKQPDYYISHEYLETDNNPCYFHQFVEHANQNELAYLADSHLPMMFPGNLKEKFRKQIEAIRDIVKVGQYMDFIRNQRFRSTLICHKDKTIDRALTAESVEPFYIAYSGMYKGDIQEADLAEGKPLEFEIAGIKLSLSHAAAKTAMKVLYDNVGKPMSYDALLKATAKKTGLDEAQTKNLLNNELNLTRLLLAGLVKIHADEGFYTDKLTDKPKTTALIRHMAQVGDRVPNRRHETYTLTPVERSVLQMLTGDVSVSKILTVVSKEIKDKIVSKELILSDEKGEPVTDNNAIAERSEKVIREALRGLVKKAYLI